MEVKRFFSGCTMGSILLGHLSDVDSNFAPFASCTCAAQDVDVGVAAHVIFTAGKQKGFTASLQPIFYNSSR